MDIYLDIDIIIDYIADRQPHAEQAEKIFALMEQGKISGNTSAHSFVDLYYLLMQRMTRARAVSVLKTLSGLIHLLKVDEEAVMKTLDDRFNDFGDALQFHSAVDYKRIDAIVTRNRKDFKGSGLPVMTPDAFLKTYEQTLTA